MKKQVSTKFLLTAALQGASLVLVVVGIGLLIWLFVGQYVAQLNYDGQYLNWRTIKDVSLWGYTGIGAEVLAVICWLFSVVIENRK